MLQVLWALDVGCRSRPEVAHVGRPRNGTGRCHGRPTVSGRHRPIIKGGPRPGADADDTRAPERMSGSLALCISKCVIIRLDF